MQAPPGNVVPDAPHANATAAVIVTHEPDESVSRMVRDVAHQVDAVVVVDNGSRPAVVAALERWRDELGVATILNGGNRGLAPALNQGLAWAAERGYPWALLLDQDATPRRGLVASAHDAFREARHTNVAVISAASDGRRTRDCRCIAEETAAAITAGSVHSVAAWRALGGFREDFFTDYVDIEYCLRARESGYVILRLCRSAIEHEVGRPSQHRLGWRLVTTTNHDRDRRYHITRNRVLVWRRYARREARFVWRDIRAFVKESVKLALFEDDRVRKGGAIVRGLADGVRGPADGIATG
jgi:rhamnosyltransferase